MGADPDSGKHVIIKSGKYGPYLQRGEGGEGNTASIPETIPPADLALPKALELLAKPQGPQVVGTDEETGKSITSRTGRFGAYLQLGEDEDKKKARKVALTYGPKHLPISRTLDIEHLTVEQAKQIISLPRVVGELSGEPVTASVGRFGPYLKKGDDFRSIPADKDLLTITIAEAETIFAQEKKGRGGRKKATLLKELGADRQNQSKSSMAVIVVCFQWYAYVCVVPKDILPVAVTLEQALAWLSEKKQKRKKKG